jgi:hypothetical protein
LGRAGASSEPSRAWAEAAKTWWKTRDTNHERHLREDVVLLHAEHLDDLLADLDRSGWRVREEGHGVASDPCDRVRRAAHGLEGVGCLPRAARDTAAANGVAVELEAMGGKNEVTLPGSREAADGPVLGHLGEVVERCEAVRRAHGPSR